jgi:hypothetical protein
MTDRTHHHSAHDRGAHDQGAHDHPGHVETGVYSHEGTPVPPSYAGSVVPEVGGMVGALVLYASALLAGAEVEVVRQGEPGHTTHSAVRQRQLAPRRHTFAAFYPGLPAGDYRADGCRELVTVNGGRVTEASLETE